MKKIFICSPYRGNVRKNVRAARSYCRKAALLGFIPIAPHLLFTQFLDDCVESERNLGIEAGIALMKTCESVWVFGEPSQGMLTEIALAAICGIPVLSGKKMLRDCGVGV